MKCVRSKQKQALLKTDVLMGIRLGNIPLNELLDKTSLGSISLEEGKALRTSIEVKWNNLNLIRSISSGVSFVLLVVSFIFLDK